MGIGRTSQTKRAGAGRLLASTDELPHQGKALMGDGPTRQVGQCYAALRRWILRFADLARAITYKLLAIPAHRTARSIPPSPRYRLRAIPNWCFRYEMRPSPPARQARARRNQRCFSWEARCLLCFPGLGIA